MKYKDYYKELLREGNQDGLNQVPEELQMAYAKLATEQRGDAETLGAIKQHRLFQGSLSYPLEHIGDLVHRLSYNFDESKHFGAVQGGGGAEYGRGAALEKIRKALYYAQDFNNFGGMKKFVIDTAKRNYDYVMREKNYEKYEDTFEKEWDNALKYLHKYAQEHAALTPLCYSYYQKLGNKATIALGMLDEGSYIKSLTELKNLLEKKDWKRYWYSPEIKKFTDGLI